MDIGHFYYLKESYFEDFPDGYLMSNKESINGQPHDRPCFFAFKDTSTGLYWMIPFYSQVKKYQNYYNQKIQRNGVCDTIVFGKVLGFKKAFLIQNMCPVTVDYIKNEYFDSNNNSVKIDKVLEKELIVKAKKSWLYRKKEKSLFFPMFLL